MSSSAMRKGYVKRPRTQPLGRGKACTNCRHLKIKCDGRKPVCGQCTRIPREDGCEYRDSSSRTRMLQDTLYRLQSRVHELEEPSFPSFPDAPLGQQLFPEYNHADSDESSQITSEANTPNSGDSFTPNASISSGAISEQPVAFLDVIPDLLLQAFLPAAFQFGFFLNIPRFQDLLYSGSPPLPSLLNAVYLWGSHLTALQDLETSLLRTTLGHICIDVSTCSGMRQVMQTIQAEVLLATYFLRVNRLVEAEYHANGAMSLVIAYNIHKGLSDRPLDPDTHVADSIDHGETINGFWEVLYIRKCLSLTIDRRRERTFGVFEPPECDIDTPWPLSMEDYQLGIIPRATERTLRSIFSFDVTEEGYHWMSPTALLKKGIIILQRSTCIARRWSHEFSPQEAQSYRNAQNVLERAIRATMHTIGALISSQDDYPCLHVTRAMLHCASMKLHHTSCNSSVDSKVACHASALAMLVALKDGARLTCPIMGTLCVLAAEALLEDLSKLAISSDSGMRDSEAPHELKAERVMTVRLLMEFMRTRSGSSPLLSSQLQTVENILFQL